MFNVLQLQFSDAYDFPDSPSGSFAMQIVSPSVQVNIHFLKVLMCYYETFTYLLT